LGHKIEKVEHDFGHILNAFKYGVPPHGGIAVGLDRLYMILLKESTIRDVIAFAKAGDGKDLMMNAPDSVEPAQLKDLGIKLN
ncbi:MAG: amino acid--tRNA ligase-related protein, partial [Patescibacteria group bacterium]